MLSIRRYKSKGGLKKRGSMPIQPEMLPVITNPNYYLGMLEEYNNLNSTPVQVNKFVQKTAHNTLNHYRTKSFNYNENRPVQGRISLGRVSLMSQVPANANNADLPLII